MPPLTRHPEIHGRVASLRVLLCQGLDTRRGIREYRLYATGKPPAVPSGPVGTHDPNSRFSSLFFSRQRKGEAKRKHPADVRKLKNRLRGPGKKNSPGPSCSSRSAGYTAPGLRPIRLGSNIFSPRSSLSAIFLSAFSHRPEGLRASVMPHFNGESGNTGKGYS